MKYQVLIATAGDNDANWVYGTLSEAQKQYDELLSRLEGTEKYHPEDNTYEYLYIELHELTFDEDGEIENVKVLKESDWYYRDALMY